MKKAIIYFLFLLHYNLIWGQNNVSFDQFSFTEPANFTFADNGTYHTYTNIDRSANAFCIISIYNSVISSGNSNDDFTNSWKDLVANHFKVSQEPSLQQKSAGNGLNYTAGESPVKTTQGGELFVQLLVFDLPGKSQAILLLSPSQSALAHYKTDIDNFLGSLKSIVSNTTTANNIDNSNTVISTSNKSGISLVPTSFDDGWSAIPKDDYILLTKNIYKVYLYYGEKFNNESRDHTVDYFYSHQLSKEYTITTVVVRSDNYHYYIEGEATENSTGKKCYLAMDVVAQNGVARTVIAISPSQAEHKQQFGNNLKNMIGHNRFGVALQDMVGTWRVGSGSSLSYFDYSTGNFAGANAVVMSDKFIFNSNSSYEAEFKGAAGMVGNMKTYQQEFKGKFSVLSPWQISTIDQDNKTVIYDCWFEPVKGGRIFHLINHEHPGLTFDLIKQD